MLWPAKSLFFFKSVLATALIWAMMDILLSFCEESAVNKRHDNWKFDLYGENGGNLYMKLGSVTFYWYHSMESSYGAHHIMKECMKIHHSCLMMKN